MRSAVLLTVVLTALAFTANAGAGCFATAGLAPPPATLGAGDTWKATITVKQHGVRPIPDATPTLTIVGEDGARKQFAATPTGEVGVYAAAVVFPRSGRWSYEVNDGFVDHGGGQTWDCSSTHTFAAVSIGDGGSSGPAPGDPSSGAAPAEPAAAAPADDGPVSFLIVVLVAAAVSLAAATGVVLARRSGRRHARA